MFIDNLRDGYGMNYAVDKATKENNEISHGKFSEVTSDLYEAKNALGSEMRDKIEFLDIRKTPVSINV